jgi:hypothetical protein
MRRVLSLSLLLAGCGEEPADTDTSATCPRMVASAEVLTLTDVLFTTPRAVDLLVDNRCDEGPDLVLERTEEPLPEGFEVGEGPWTVPPGGRAEIPITFTAADYTPVEGALVLSTTDPDRPALRIPLTGEPAGDQDLDGFDATEVGGEDCDDADPGIYPGRDDLADGLDQDCDGRIDEGAIQPGDVLITELLTSVPGSDFRQQWLEVHNTSGRSVDLSGWTLDMGGRRFTLTEAVPLEPGGWGLLTRSTDPELTGVETPLAVLDGPDQPISSAGDFVATLAVEERPIHRLDGAPLPEPALRRAIQLDPTRTTLSDAAVGSSWCRADTVAENGVVATPAAANTWCPTVDHDGDGTPLEDDCDDTDPLRGPEVMERLDRRDNDCNDIVDDLAYEDRSGEARFATTFQMKAPSLADLDDDGANEVILTTDRPDGQRVWVLDGAAFNGVPFEPALRNEVEVVVDLAAPVGRAPDRAPDLDGDGIDDLILPAVDAPARTLAWIHHEGLPPADRADWDVVVTRPDAPVWSRWHGTAAGGDLDGDGVDELILGAGGDLERFGTVWVAALDGAAGILSVADLSGRAWSGDAPEDAVGTALASGDLDGDGYDDVVVRGDGGRSAYIVAGGTGLPADGPLRDAADSRMPISAGGPVAGGLMIADLEADGALDLVVAGREALEIWFGSEPLLSRLRLPDRTVEAPEDGLFNASAVGDIDHDGASEVALGLQWSGRTGTTTAIHLFDGTLLESSDPVSWDAPTGQVAGRQTPPQVTTGFGEAIALGAVFGGLGDDLLVAEPGREDGTGAPFPTLWAYPGE